LSLPDGVAQIDTSSPEVGTTSTRQR